MYNNYNVVVHLNTLFRGVHLDIRPSIHPSGRQEIVLCIKEGFLMLNAVFFPFLVGGGGINK